MPGQTRAHTKAQLAKLVLAWLNLSFVGDRKVHTQEVSMPQQTITLESLQNVPVLPRGAHIALLQKSIVTFDSQHFGSGLFLLVECTESPCNSNAHQKETCFQIVWQETVDEALRCSHADLNESVEDSAKAVAMLLIQAITPYKIGRQAPRGTHVDNFLVSADAELPFQANDTACLEFTGILNGIEKIDNRIKEKRERLHKKRNFPTYIVCVEHSFPVARIERVEP